MKFVNDVLAQSISQNYTQTSEKTTFGHELKDVIDSDCVTTAVRIGVPGFLKQESSRYNQIYLRYFISYKPFPMLDVQLIRQILRKWGTEAWNHRCDVFAS